MLLHLKNSSRPMIKFQALSTVIQSTCIRPNPGSETLSDSVLTFIYSRKRSALTDCYCERRPDH